MSLWLYLVRNNEYRSLEHRFLVAFTAKGKHKNYVGQVYSPSCWVQAVKYSKGAIFKVVMGIIEWISYSNDKNINNRMIIRILFFLFTFVFRGKKEEKTWLFYVWFFILFYIENLACQLSKESILSLLTKCSQSATALLLLHISLNAYKCEQLLTHWQRCILYTFIPVSCSLLLWNLTFLRLGYLQASDGGTIRPNVSSTKWFELCQIAAAVEAFKLKKRIMLISPIYSNCWIAWKV